MLPPSTPSGLSENVAHPGDPVFGADGVDGRSLAAHDHGSCLTSFRPAPSPSFSPTSKARRDCCTSWAPRRTRRRSPSTGGSCAKRSPARAAWRWTRRGTRSSMLPDRTGRARGSGPGPTSALRRSDQRAHRPAHRHAAPVGGRATWARTCTAPPASPPPPTAARWWSRVDAALVDGRAPRAGRAPAQGHLGARAALPARAGRLSPAEEISNQRICPCRRRRSSAVSEEVAEVVELLRERCAC